MKDRGSNPRQRVHFFFFVFSLFIFVWKYIGSSLILSKCTLLLCTIILSFCIHLLIFELLNLLLFIIEYNLPGFLTYSTFLLYSQYGGVAQMVEHSLCMRGAAGSMPATSTFFCYLCIFFFFWIFFFNLLFHSLFIHFPHFSLGCLFVYLFLIN